MSSSARWGREVTGGRRWRAQHEYNPLPPPPLPHLPSFSLRRRNNLISQTEGALLALVGKMGQNYWELRVQRMDASRGDRLFPFSSARKRMTTLIHGSTGGDVDGQRVYSKGAAEILLESCQYQTKANGARCGLSRCVCRGGVIAWPCCLGLGTATVYVDLTAVNGTR